MSTVDDRVVSMQFDNKQFEQNIGTTMGSLDKLNTSLQFPEGKKGLADIAAAASKFSLAGIGNAAEGVSTKFLAMATVGITALTNLTNKAINSGEQLVKSLTTAPIMGGFNEYEQGLTAFQTVLANTKSAGTTVNDVNAALATMNDYANKTIFSFGDMTKAIGLFTAQGVSLKDSTTGIKGIFNLVSLTGGDADKANSAIYQLSQAIASGTVRAQDWISVVNAGIGGTDFQNQLKATARQHGIAVDAMIKSEGSFKDSLKDGWLSSQVLMETLSKYTGDLSAQQLQSMGYSKQQAEQMAALGQTALSSATKMKSLTQLMDTLRSNVVTGWASTFKILVGNLDEASVLWTKIGGSISNVLQASSDGRNQLLQGWKNAGGRDLLLQGFGNALFAIKELVKPVQEAFRNIFPKTSVDDLLKLTLAFRKLTDHLLLSEDTYKKIRVVATGFFAALQIGWTVIKEVVKVVAGLFGDLAGAAIGPLGKASNIVETFSAKIINLNDKLVRQKGIANFFDNIRQNVATAVDAVQNFIGKIVAIVEASSALDTVMAKTKDIGSSIANAVQGFHGFDAIPGIFSTVWEHIKGFFSSLGSKVAALFGKINFGQAASTAATGAGIGLLAGLALAIKRFFDNLNKLDVKGIIESVKSSFDQLTGVLQGMQQKVKAEALEKIAISVGVLTASMIALTLVDQAKLAVSLATMATGFGELVATMKLLDVVASDSKTAAKIGVLAGAMIGIAAAMDLLAISVTIFAHTDQKDLAKGIAAITVLLTELVATIKILSGDTDGVIRASLAMIAMATSMSIMAGAVKLFAMMSWHEIEKGLSGMAAALGAVVLAMNLMPKEGMIGAGIGMLAISTALVILSQAVKLFGEISLGELAKGIIAIDFSLGSIAATMQAMPIDLPITASGMVILAGALIIMSKAVDAMGSIKLETLAKGIGAIALTLIVLVAAMAAMQDTAAGAAAMIVSAAALDILANVIEKLGKLKISEILTGLGAIAGVFIVLGLAGLVLGPLVPVLIGLGVALTLVGAGFALFGAGAYLVAQAFQAIANASDASVKAVIDILKKLAAALPDILVSFIKGLGDLGNALVEAAPPLIKALVVIIGMLLDAIVKLTPKLAEAIAKFVPAALKLIRDLAPDIIQTGIDLLVDLLIGLGKNIDQVVSAAVGIITGFAQTLADNAGPLVDAGVNLIIAFVQALGSRAGDLVQAGADLIAQFMIGIASAIGTIADGVTQIITAIITAIGQQLQQIVDAGANMLTQLLQGVTRDISKVLDAVVAIFTEFVTDVGAKIQMIIDAGADMLAKFLEGFGRDIKKVGTAVGDLVTTFLDTFGTQAKRIAEAGAIAIAKFIEGIDAHLGDIINAAGDLILNFIQALSGNALKVINAAADMLVNFLNGLAQAIRAHSEDLRQAGLNIAGALLSGITGGLSDHAGDVVSSVTGIFGKAINAGKHAIGANSPSKVFYEIAGYMTQGLVNGLNDNTTVAASSASLAKRSTDAFQAAMTKIPDALLGAKEFNPTITPILDLSQVQLESKKLPGFMSIGAIAPNLSLDRANLISTTADAASSKQPQTVPATPQQVTFNQNNYSPTALSTNDIYRKTNSQIALAKAKLGVPGETN